MAINRRRFLKTTGLGITVLSLSGTPLLLSPAEARARNISFKVLTTGEVAILDAFADTLLPGASESGVAHFIDEQLSRAPNDSLLLARYLQIEPPYTGFYKGGLATLNGYCVKTFEKSFVEMDRAARKAFVATLFRMGPQGPINPQGWTGPPAPMLYLCIRSDAVDVTYGTMAGFEKLKVPYMAHIEPPANW